MPKKDKKRSALEPIESLSSSSSKKKPKKQEEPKGDRNADGFNAEFCELCAEKVVGGPHDQCSVCRNLFCKRHREVKVYRRDPRISELATSGRCSHCFIPNGELICARCQVKDVVKLDEEWSKFCMENMKNP